MSGRVAGESRAERCLRLHYRLMDRKRFWYSKVLMDRSKRLCVEASNIRAAERLKAKGEVAA